MKKTVLFLFISLVLMITGCTKDVTINLDNVYSNLESKYEGFVKVDEDTLSGNYGLDLDVFKNYLVVMNEKGTTGKMYAIFEAGNSLSDAEEEATYFVDKYVQSWDNNYFPEETKLVKNATLEKYGNYFIYVVNENSDDIISKIKNSK